MEQEKKEKLCPYCKAAVDDSVSFCRACGKTLRTPTGVSVFRKENITRTAGKAYSNASATYAGTMCDPTPVLTWGILGLSFAIATGVLGIIFSLIGLNKYKQFMADTAGAYSRKAQIGRGLSIAGFIAGIVITALVIVYIIIIVSALKALSNLP